MSRNDPHIAVIGVMARCSALHVLPLFPLSHWVPMIGADYFQPTRAFKKRMEPAVNDMASPNRSRFRRSALALVVMMALLLAACGGSDSAAPADPVASPPDPTGVGADPTVGVPAPATPAPATPAPATPAPATPAPATPAPATPAPATPAPARPAPATPAPATPAPPAATPVPPVPVSQPRPVTVACTITPQRNVRPGEYLTFRAVQNPSNVAVSYIFDHGDGTLDATHLSKAYYAAPGTYTVTLHWSHAGGRGTSSCGTVTVDGFVPTPPPVVQPLVVTCSISPNRAVRPGEILTFRALQNRPDVAVSYTFDHGDGTLDRRAVSEAYYEAPGVYEVRLSWTSAAGNGSKLCGTVTVDGFVPTNPPVFNAADYLGKSRSAAEATAAQKGLLSRVTRIDAETFAVTMDHRTDRVNFEIDAGIVTKATIG